MTLEEYLKERGIPKDSEAENYILQGYLFACYKCETNGIFEGFWKSKFFELASVVKKMRKCQRQWRDGYPWDCTHVGLAKNIHETEKEVDEYLKKMEE